MTERQALLADCPEIEAKADDESVIGVELHHHKQRIVIGDCLEQLERMEPRSVAVVVTSPPYNIGTSYRSTRDAMADEDYLAWVGYLVKSLDRVLAASGSIFLNMGGCASRPWQAHEVASVFRERFVLQNEIAWIKSITVNQQTFGHFKPINSKRFLNRTSEKVFHFTRNGGVPLDRLGIGVPYKDKTNISRWGGARKDLRCGGNTWFIPYATVRSRKERANHPATFPVELARRCLRLVGVQGVVLDPFVGTGSTLVAAHELGMEGIGMEIDPGYAWSAYERLQLST